MHGKQQQVRFQEEKKEEKILSRREKEEWVNA
jgi:hypothetical protein